MIFMPSVILLFKSQETGHLLEEVRLPEGHQGRRRKADFHSMGARLQPSERGQA